MKKIRAFMVAIMLAFALTACNPFWDRWYADSIVWANDGYIYFLRDSFDGPHDELWRQTPHGSPHRVAFQVPVEVETNITCNAKAEPFLWPDRSLGLSYACATNTYFYAVGKRMHLSLVTILPTELYGVVWSDFGQNGLARAGDSCLGFLQVHDGKMTHFRSGFPGFDLDAQDGSCGSTGVGTIAAFDPGDRSWIFVLSPNVISHSDLKILDAEGSNDRLYFLAYDKQSYHIIDGEFKDVSRIAISSLGDDIGLICSDHAESVLLIVDSYSGKVLLKKSGIDDVGFSPEGMRIAYAPSTGGLAISDEL